MTPLRERTNDAKTTVSVYGVPIPFVRVLGFLLWFWFGSFLVLDDAICVVGECGFSQCTVPKSTVPFPMAPPCVGRGVIFFLLKLFFTHDSRTLPGFALPGVSTTLLFGDQPAVCGVRLRTSAADDRADSTADDRADSTADDRADSTADGSAGSTADDRANSGSTADDRADSNSTADDHAAPRPRLKEQSRLIEIENGRRRPLVALEHCIALCLEEQTEMLKRDHRCLFTGTW